MSTVTDAVLDRLNTAPPEEKKRSGDLGQEALCDRSLGVVSIDQHCQHFLRIFLSHSSFLRRSAITGDSENTAVQGPWSLFGHHLRATGGDIKRYPERRSWTEGSGSRWSVAGTSSRYARVAVVVMLRPRRAAKPRTSGLPSR